MEHKILKALEARLNHYKNLESSQNLNSIQQNEMKELQSKIASLKTHMNQIDSLNHQIFQKLEELRILKESTPLFKVFLKKTKNKCRAAPEGV
jgi:chromosome segregation ATPase